MLKTLLMGSGCGSVGRAVAPDTRVPGFKSSQDPNFIMNISTVNCCKDNNKEKERAQEWPIFYNIVNCKESKALII